MRCQVPTCDLEVTRFLNETLMTGWVPKNGVCLEVVIAGYDLDGGPDGSHVLHGFEVVPADKYHRQLGLVVKGGVGPHHNLDQLLVVGLCKQTKLSKTTFIQHT